MSDINPYIIALGNFDGLHLGHKALLEEIIAIKKAMAEDNKKSISAVVTFYPHPLAYLKGYSPPLLLGDEEKAAFLKEYMAIDEICTLNFDEKMANSDPQSFLEQLLLEKMPACHVVIGFNFRFGYQGKGDGEFLKNFCRQHNIGISIIPAVKDDLGIISSSFIREKISQGQIEAADQMLGYWYHMAGKVVHGKQLGRTIGFHTANVLPPQNRQLPPNGVYAVRVIYHGCLYSGIANIGFRPTVEKK
ncbi:MAG: riboflavin kinase, partial [Clostridiales bacterium]